MAAASDSMSLPVGFRFHPTEEELINHYLKNKIQGKDLNNVIPEIDLHKYEPWDLPGFSLIVSNDDEWYYFSRPQYLKSNNRSRIRTTKRGFWKITSGKREIKARDSRAVIGEKRTLTFYEGKVRSGKKSIWVIHEYYIPNTDQRNFELIRLKKKDESTDIAACDEGEPRTNNALVHQEDFPEETTRPKEIYASLSPTPESPSNDVLSSIKDFATETTRPKEIYTSLSPTPESPSNDVLFSIKDFAMETTPPDEIISSLFATPEPPLHIYQLQSGYESPQEISSATKRFQSAGESPTRRLKPMAVKYTTTQVTHQAATSWNNHSAQSVTGRIELHSGESAGSLIVWKTSPLSLKSYLPVVCTCIVIGICSYFLLGT